MADLGQVNKLAEFLLLPEESTVCHLLLVDGYWASETRIVFLSLIEFAKVHLIHMYLTLYTEKSIIYCFIHLR